MAHSKIPAESTALLESAIKLLNSHQLCADEIVLMAYHMGRVDGRMEQLDRSEAMVREELGINAYVEAMTNRDQATRLDGRPEHDRDTRGNPMASGR